MLFYSRKPKGLNGALQDLGIQFSGREHSGLDDSRNTAQLAARMMRDGCIMKITKSLGRNPQVGEPKFGKSVSSPDSKENQTSVKENAPTSKSSSEAPHTASQVRPCSENHTKDLDTKRVSVSAQPSVPACQSLISPKTLLNGSTEPLWGRSRRSAASDRGCSTSRSVTMNPALTGTHFNNNKSLVLCSTTVSCFSNPLQQNQVVGMRLKSGLMEEDAQLMVETQERCGSDDDVVLEEINGHDSDFQSYTEFISEFDSGCCECVETEGPPVRVVSDHLNDVMQHGRTSTTYVTAARRKTEPQKPIKASLKESVHQRKSVKTGIPSSITPKSFFPEKTSTPHTSFKRPEPVLMQLKHHKPMRSSFTVYSESREQAPAPPRSSPGPLHTPNILSSLSTNTRSSSSRCSFSAAKGAQRVTSPLCECGRRAKRQLVSNGGPNHGRGFYCCPVRRSSGGRVEKGCQFFKWESAVIKSRWVPTPVRSSVSLCQANSNLSLQLAHRPTRKSY